jgi:hypothetical protein
VKKFVSLAFASATILALAIPATAQTPIEDNVMWGGNKSVAVRPLVWQTQMSLLLPGNPVLSVVKSVIWGNPNSKSVIWGNPNSKSVIWGNPNSKSVIWGNPNSKNIVWGG